MYQRILMIDNQDSFTYNIVDYLRQLGCQVVIYRNSASPEALEAEDFDLLILSPGPSVPSQAGNLMAIIERFHTRKPIFGICLGLQALVEFFGGSLQFVAPVHGKSGRVIHDGRSIYTGLPQELQMGRYHSLAADQMPSVLEVTARTPEGIVMSIRHKQLPIEAVQFHPESVLSMRQDAGFALLRNVVEGRLSTGNVNYFHLMHKLLEDEPLRAQDFDELVGQLVENQLTDDQKLVLLTSISTRLRNPLQLSRFLESLLARAAWKPTFGTEALDVCGTGGSHLPRLNTSTLTALCLAANGVPILKHGNRAASGRFGSFDLLAALGLDLHWSEAQVAERYQRTGLGFVFAPVAHPALGAFGPSRARVGVPTIFNVLGPLLNPFRPQRQMIGTAYRQYMEILGDAACLLGKHHVAIVRGHDGLDEISASGPTDVLELRGSQRDAYQLHPALFGTEPVPFDAVRVDTPSQAVAIAQSMLQGDLQTEHYRLVALNAAFAYAHFHQPESLPEAYARMVETLRSGRLGECWAAYSGLAHQPA